MTNLSMLKVPGNKFAFVSAAPKKPLFSFRFRKPRNHVWFIFPLLRQKHIKLNPGAVCASGCHRLPLFCLFCV